MMNAPTPADPPKSRFPQHLTDVGFAVAASLLWLLLYNLRFWDQALAAMWRPTAAGSVFIVSLFLLVLYLQATALLVMPGRTAMRVAASVFFVVASLGAYFADAFGVMMNKDMMRNVFQTDVTEAGDLINLRLILYFVLLGVLPAVLLWRVPLRATSFRRAFGTRARFIVGGLAVCAVFTLATSASYAVFLREYKPVRFLLSPASIVSSTIGYLAADTRPAVAVTDPGGEPTRVAPAQGPQRPAATAARKPLLVFMVVGETARAANFQLDGYARQTNPQLTQQVGLTYFKDAASCGTSTAASLPCMFSSAGREAFRDADARKYANVLDMLQRAGIAVEWRDNNSGCKGVCQRVPTVDYFRDPAAAVRQVGGSAEEAAALCPQSHCYDEVMNLGLDEKLAGLQQDTIVVFHQNGSHGPAYHERYPPAAEVFKPACHSSQLDNCSSAEIVNAYDNSILYTDRVLAQQIRILERYDDTVDSVLIYASDHGESLGEQGVYLHGMPYAFAPKVQKTVPMLIWLSPAFQQRSGIRTACLDELAREPRSHDNLFHTLFGALGVRNAVYESTRDLAAQCLPSFSRPSPLNSGGSISPNRTRLDLLWLSLAAALVLGAALGLRNPWPPDEQVYALIARDMLASGHWLVPQVGGDLFQDKPPLLFWLAAGAYALTGSIKVGFLLPGVLAGIATVLLIYDLGRRLWSREVGLAAGIALLTTVHFTFQAQRAQMDGLLTLWCTLGLYCLCRYLLLGDRPRWLVLGGAAAGLGILTKVVGFLPFLALGPYLFARWRKWPLPTLQGAAGPWIATAGAAALIVALWLVPLLVLIGSAHDPQLLAYRDELLLQQTFTRFSTPWHHLQPAYYYATVILTQWMPVGIVLPWLIPLWWQAVRQRDTRILLLLGYVVSIVLLFSLSAGKRDVYILPVLPAFVLCAAAYLPQLVKRRAVQRVALGVSLALLGVCAVAYVGLQFFLPAARADLRADLGVTSLLPLLLSCAFGLPLVWRAGLRHAAQGLAALVALIWIVASLEIYPQIDASRSAAAFIARLEAVADPSAELGLVEYKEQFLWNLQRESVNFGHRRFREGEQELYDAARWLNGGNGRQLLVMEPSLTPCFSDAAKLKVGKSSGGTWWLVTGVAATSCVVRGSATSVYHYTPPAPGWVSRRGRCDNGSPACQTSRD